MTVLQSFRPAARESCRSIQCQEIFQSEQVRAVGPYHQFSIQALERPLVFIHQNQFAVLYEDTLHDRAVVVLVAYAQIGIEFLYRVAVRQRVRELLERFQQRITAHDLQCIHGLLYVRQRTERRYGRADVEPIAQEAGFLQVITQPYGRSERIVSMVFGAFLEPGARHTYASGIA